MLELRTSFLALELLAIVVGCMLELRTSFLALEFGKQFKRVVMFSIKAFGGFRGEIVV